MTSFALSVCNAVPRGNFSLTFGPFLVERREMNKEFDLMKKTISDRVIDHILVLILTAIVVLILLFLMGPVVERLPEYLDALKR